MCTTGRKRHCGAHTHGDRVRHTRGDRVVAGGDRCARASGTPRYWGGTRRQDQVHTQRQVRARQAEIHARCQCQTCGRWWAMCTVEWWTILWGQWGTQAAIQTRCTWANTRRQCRTGGWAHTWRQCRTGGGRCARTDGMRYCSTETATVLDWRWVVGAHTHGDR